MTGANARIIRFRISSDPSPCDPSGERLREREFRGVDCPVLPLGELDRDGAAEDVDDWRPGASERLSADSESVEIRGSED